MTSKSLSRANLESITINTIQNSSDKDGIYYKDTQQDEDLRHALERHIAI